jgi:hypothetical protein
LLLGALASVHGLGAGLLLKADVERLIFSLRRIEAEPGAKLEEALTTVLGDCALRGPSWARRACANARP